MDYEKEIIDLKNELYNAYSKIYALASITVQMIEEDGGLPEETKQNTWIKYIGFKIRGNSYDRRRNI